MPIAPSSESVDVGRVVEIQHALIFEGSVQEEGSPCRQASCKPTQNAVPAGALRNAAVFLTRSDYAEVVEERACESRCGLPSCSHELRKRKSKSKFVIQRRLQKVADASSLLFCSEVCRLHSAQLSARLASDDDDSSSPSTARGHGSGSGSSSSSSKPKPPRSSSSSGGAPKSAAQRAAEAAAERLPEPKEPARLSAQLVNAIFPELPKPRAKKSEVRVPRKPVPSSLSSSSPPSASTARPSTSDRSSAAPANEQDMSTLVSQMEKLEVKAGRSAKTGSSSSKLSTTSATGGSGGASEKKTKSAVKKKKKKTQAEPPPSKPPPPGPNSLVGDIRETSPDELDKKRLYEDLLDMVEVTRRKERTAQARADADTRRAEAREKYLKEHANAPGDVRAAESTSAPHDHNADADVDMEDGDPYAVHGDLQYFDDASASEDQKEARMDMIREAESRYAPMLSPFATLMRHMLSWSAPSLGFYMMRHKSPEMSAKYDTWRASFRGDDDYAKKLTIFSQRVSRFVRPLCSQLGMTDVSTRLAERGMPEIIGTLSFRESVPSLKPQDWCLVALILLKCLELAQSPFSDAALEVPHSASDAFAKVLAGLKYDASQYESLIKLFYDEYSEPGS